MFKDFFKKSDNEKDKKKQMENIIIFIIILIVTVLIINSVWSSDNKGSKEKTQDNSKVLAQTSTSGTSEQDDLETKIEDILEIYKKNDQCTNRSRHTSDIEKINKYIEKKTTENK